MVCSLFSVVIELAPVTVSLTGDRVRGNNSKHYAI